MNGKMIQLATKELVRNYILSIAEQCAGEGASTIIIKSVLKKNGVTVTDEELTREIKYLAGKNLISVKHIENTALKIKRDVISITPEGMDVLDGTSSVLGVEAGE